VSLCVPVADCTAHCVRLAFNVCDYISIFFKFRIREYFFYIFTLPESTCVQNLMATLQMFSVDYNDDDDDDDDDVGYFVVS